MDRREQIIQHAAAMFEAGGYASASMEQLAVGVGVAKATLYHYFDSKEAILFEIQSRFIDLLVSRQRAREASGLPPQDQLRAIIGDVLELMDSHRGYVRIFFEDHRDLSGERRKVVDEHRREHKRMTEGVVQAAIDSGHFREVDVRLAVLAMYGMCNWAYQWYKPEGAMRPHDIASFFFSIYEDGMRKRPSADDPTPLAASSLP